MESLSTTTTYFLHLLPAKHSQTVWPFSEAIILYVYYLHLAGLTSFKTLSDVSSMFSLIPFEGLRTEGVVMLCRLLSPWGKYSNINNVWLCWIWIQFLIRLLNQNPFKTIVDSFWAVCLVVNEDMLGKKTKTRENYILFDFTQYNLKCGYSAVLLGLSPHILVLLDIQ